MRRTQIYLDEDLRRRVDKVAAAEDPIRGFIGGAEGGPVDAAREHDRYLYGSDRRGDRARKAVPSTMKV